MINVDTTYHILTYTFMCVSFQINYPQNKHKVKTANLVCGECTKVFLRIKRKRDKIVIDNFCR